MAFEDKLPEQKVSLKKTNKTSKFNSESSNKNKENFENLADASFSKMEDYKNRTWDLSRKFKSFIESQILSENKGPIVSNLEKETIDQLIVLATEMNEDELQSEGFGSTALCMLLMKCMLIQRDITNDLRYKIAQLEKNATK